MAHIQRVIFILMLLVYGQSYALVVKATSYTITALAGTFASASEACTAKYKAIGGSSGVVDSSGTSCSVYANGSIFANYTITPVLACPANSTASGTSCACTSPYVENAAKTACVTAADAKCLATVGQSSFVEAAGIVLAGATTCVASDGGGGCMMTLGNSVTTVTNKTTGAKTSESLGVGTGASCDPTTQTLSVAVDPCPNGVLGTVNGLSTCVAYDPNLNVIQSTSTTSNSSTATSASGAASSASSGTTVTTCSGAGSCVTTTTTTSSVNGGAATTTTDTTTQSLDDYCKSNPTATACKSSQGSFSGSCGSEPACTGDAVMCAVASAAFKTNCALQVSETSDEQTAYDTAKTKTGDQTGTLPGNGSISVGPGDFNETNILGSSSGMQDLTITVMSSTVTLPLSSINIWLERLGYLLQAVTLVICAYIVTGNKQGGAA